MSLEDAWNHGARCIQIFASSPGAWKPPRIDELRAASLLNARTDVGIQPLFLHAIYLINLASPDPQLLNRSRASLAATLGAASLLGARGVITHIGSHGGRGFAAVAEQVATSLTAVLDTTPDDVDLLLENSAGAGGIIGGRLEELGSLIDLAGRPSRLRIAIDTAHLCASGWDFAGNQEAARRLVGEIESIVGLDRLELVHANDSKTPCGSRKDRHANVGDGYIGMAGFASLLMQPELRKPPWILETPDLDARLEAGRRFGSLKRLRELAARVRVEAGAHRDCPPPPASEASIGGIKEYLA
jgi:deoxyribonuclease-4